MFLSKLVRNFGTREISIHDREFFCFHVSGSVVLFPCVYAFGCRQVVLRPDGTKVLFTKGDQPRKIVLRVTNDNKAYIVSLLFILSGNVYILLHLYWGWLLGQSVETLALASDSIPDFFRFYLVCVRSIGCID